MMNGRAYIAEFIGTFTLVFIGAGAVMVNAAFGGGGLVGIALAHGLTLMVMIYALGHISGTHINPAVTIAMLFGRQIGTVKAIGYIIAQLLGAALAGVVLNLPAPNDPSQGAYLGATLPGGVQEASFVMLIELILTFFLVLVIYSVAVDDRAPKGFAGLAIGMTLAFCILMGGPLTGASLNPARTFGPAFGCLLAGAGSAAWKAHLAYWIGPILGGILASIVYQFGLKQQEND